MFGAVYGVAYLVLYDVLGAAGLPLFWDKLLPVPVLNLAVPLVERACRPLMPERVSIRWDAPDLAHRANLGHMAVWVALFVAMVSTGFIGGRL